MPPYQSNEPDLRFVPSRLLPLARQAALFPRAAVFGLPLPWVGAQVLAAHAAGVPVPFHYHRALHAWFGLPPA